MAAEHRINRVCLLAKVILSEMAARADASSESRELGALLSVEVWQ